MEGSSINRRLLFLIRNRNVSRWFFFALCYTVLNFRNWVKSMNPSGITIKDLLQLPVLKEAKVISGNKGLNRIVRFIDIMEVPDIGSWLREGELLLTTAYSIRHDLSLLPKLVETLGKANAAALAIKPERYLQTMPKEMIDISNKYEMPIIQLPNGIPYIDITNAVMELIVNKQASLLRRSEQIYKKLTNLVLENSGIQTVADNVSQMLDAPILLLDKAGDMIVASPKEYSLDVYSNNSNWNITVDKELVGKFFVEKQSLDEMDKICVEQARLVFSLELMRRKTALDTENKIRGDFIEELLTGLFLPQEEVVNKGRQLGLNPESMWEVIVIESTNLLGEEDSSLLKEINQLLDNVHLPYSNKIYKHKQGHRYVLLQSSPYEPFQTKDNYNRLQEAFRELLEKHKEIRVGFGGRSLLWEIHLSYLEGRNAIMIGSQLQKNEQIFSFEELEMFKLLLDSADYIQIEGIIEKKIGKLLHYDKENSSDLVKTLFYYLATDGSLMETAKMLFIHRNSVKYRIDRIKELTDLKLDSFQEKLICYLCVFFQMFKATK